MGCLSYICFILFILHSCDSYVLLTANVDDVHAIAEQVAKSPVVTQIRDIWQQASRTFLQHLGNKRSKSHGRQKTTTTYNYNSYVDAAPLPDVRFPQGLVHAPVLRSVQSSDSPDDNEPLQVPEDAVKEDLNPEIKRRNESPPAQLTSSQEGKSSQEAREQRRRAANALVDLGRNASVYLRSLQNILETL